MILVSNSHEHQIPNLKERPHRKLIIINLRSASPFNFFFFAYLENKSTWKFSRDQRNNLTPSLKHT